VETPKGDAMSDIPEGPYYQFWVGVRRIGEANGGDELVGLETLRFEVSAALKRQFPTAYEFLDLSKIFDQALVKAIETYDPSRGEVSTHLVWKAKDFAWRAIRRKNSHTKLEIQFSDLETDEGFGILDVIGTEDQYDLPSRYRKVLAGLDSMHFKGKMAQHSYGELIALLSEGKRRNEIAAEWGVCTASVLQCVEEVRQFITNLGVQRELEDTSG
jgi:hypothetical protein